MLSPLPNFEFGDPELSGLSVEHKDSDEGFRSSTELEDDVTQKASTYMSTSGIRALQTGETKKNREE